MSNIPEDLRYVASHEWVKPLDDGSVLIGITDHAQEALGDLVFVELPDVGRVLAAEEACGVVESVEFFCKDVGLLSVGKPVLADEGDGGWA